MRKMKKIATVTFHRAHNFGSVLQTYALQECIKTLCEEKKIEVEYRVIDLFTDNQEQLYTVFKKNSSIKNLVKNVITIPFSKQLKIKYNKFNCFVKENFQLTPKYKTDEELRNNPPIADYYISGSDQIWNVRAKDFSLSYYLDFVKKGKKISYAASFGPLEIEWDKYDKNKIGNLLSEYDNISVREQGSLKNVEILTNQVGEIHVDPTLLLTKGQWRKVQSNIKGGLGKYILLYCLEPTKEQLKIANAISHKLGLPILVLRYNNKNDMFNRYIKKYDSGPRDFLAYIDHAALVLSSSFHGTVFSLIYHKPFYVFNGMNDNRISTLLTKTNMVERSISTLKDIERISLISPDETIIEYVLESERNKSKEYLRRALGIG